MSQNKNALIRYKTIDKCLQNTYRSWTLEDLMHACSDALYEYEGKENPVSKRTVQLDIQMMRSEKLGYNAPIEVYEKKYYRYADDFFSITDIPLTETDMNVLSETVSMLKQFKDFSLFHDVSDILQRLEDKIYAEKANMQPVIYLDKNESLKGLHFLDAIYQAIIKKIVLKVSYKSFTASKEVDFYFYPFILKEFNNRWFMVGKKKANSPIVNLALDRILKIDFDFQMPFIDFVFDHDKFYENVYGVTVNSGIQPRLVKLWIDKTNAPYVLTKPLHRTQRLHQENPDGSIVIGLFMVENYEFERLLLGFGNGLEVLKPERLRTRMQYILEQALKRYQ